jgi:hypothetical protein
MIRGKAYNVIYKETNLPSDWWDIDEILMRYWWDIDEILMRYWWDIDEILMRYWWDIDEILMKIRKVGEATTLAPSLTLRRYYIIYYSLTKSQKVEKPELRRLQRNLK